MFNAGAGGLSAIKLGAAQMQAEATALKARVDKPLEAARRPGPGDQLRPGVSGPGQGGLIVRANPWANPLMGLCGRVPPALGGPAWTTKTAIRASTDGPGHSVARKKGL